MTFKELTIVVLIIVNLFNLYISSFAVSGTDIHDNKYYIIEKQMLPKQNQKNYNIHSLIRRSSGSTDNKNSTGKNKRKTTVVSENNNSKLARKGKLQNKFYTPQYEGRPPIFDYIDEEKDLTTPLDTGKKGTSADVICLLDYIFCEATRPDVHGYKDGLIYLYMHFISPYIHGETKYTKSCSIDLGFNFQGQNIIMPIYRKDNYALVLIADTKQRQLIYYDPLDPQLKKPKSKSEAAKIFKSFLEIIRMRNVFTQGRGDVVDCNGWIVVTVDKSFSLVGPDVKKTKIDYGIYALQFIDFFVNLGQQAYRFNSIIDEYYVDVVGKIVQQIWHYYWQSVIARNLVELEEKSLRAKMVSSSMLTPLRFKQLRISD